MGQPKGLLDFKGRPWIWEQIRRARAVGITDIVIVLGYDAEKYKEVLQDQNIHWVLNEAPEYGPFSSLIVGWHSIGEATFFLPIDCPAPTREVWERLDEKMVGDVNGVVPSFEGKGGHPVLLAKQFLEKLATVPFSSPHARLDYQIHKLPPREVVYVTVRDPQVLLNFNTPQVTL